MPNGKTISRVVTACFFVSGVAGLIYQLAWSRYLALFLGHTSYAVVAVLVAFMGGLALGNAWLGAVVDRSRRPLAFYAWLEIGIALYAFLFPYYFEVCHKLYVTLARGFSAGETSLLMLKFFFSLFLVLIPTAMMGATFPALTRFVTRSINELRGKVAWLYCINSLGAVFGCFVADYWWIPRFGLELSLLGSGMLNLLVGICALGLSKMVFEGERTPPAEEIHPVGETEVFTPRELRLAFWAIGLSGFVAMLYEVAWTRLLALALGSSTHAYTLMLVTFILGIAAGGAVVARCKNLRHTLEAFGWAEAALAIAVLFSMFGYEFLPYGLVVVTRHIARTPDSYPLYELVQAALCLAVMFIPAVCLGMTLPLASRIATAALAHTGRSVGRVFAVNTAGTVLGAGLTGLLFMPALGLSRTFALGVVANAFIALMILRRNSNLRRTLVVGCVGGFFLFVVAGFYFESRWQGAFSYGWWRAQQVPKSIAEFRQLSQSLDIRYYRDGASATVTVNAQVRGTNTHLFMRVNGKVDASSQGDHFTQLLLGHIPLILRPASTNALVIGLGSGMTCGAILRHPTIQNVTAVEISPEITHAARFFGEFNDHALDNPRFHLVKEDAKSFLKISDQRFDVIVSEPSNPWMAGVAGVFSQEYYQDCADHLSPDGMMVQWLQIYESSDEVFSMVLRTFSSVFPSVSIWRTQSGDLALVGSRIPPVIDLVVAKKRFDDPSIQKDMERMDIRTFPVFLSLEIASADNGSALVSAEGPIHSDYFPALEYEAQKAFFVRQSSELSSTFKEAWSSRSLLLLGRYLEHQRLDPADFRGLALRVVGGDDVDSRLSNSFYLEWLKSGEMPELALQFLENLPNPNASSLLHEERWQHQPSTFLQQATSDTEGLKSWERVLLRAYRQKRSVFHQPNADDLVQTIQKLKKLDPTNHRVYKLHEAELAWDLGDATTCFRLGKEALSASATNAGQQAFEQDLMAPRVVLTLMIEHLHRTRQWSEASGWVKAASQQKFLDHDRNFYPPLERVCRKVTTTLAQNGGL